MVIEFVGPDEFPFGRAKALWQPREQADRDPEVFHCEPKVVNARNREKRKAREIAGPVAWKDHGGNSP